jgi:hypothetical protein
MSAPAVSDTNDITMRLFNIHSKDTFIPMPGPLSKGFAPDLCHESFQARFKITLRERRLGLSWKRPWSFLDREEWQWRQIGQYEVEEAALEFGGDYVGEESRGSKVHGE